MRYALVLAGALLCIPASSQTITRSRISTGFNTIKQADLQADLRFLASPALRGRLSLSPESEKAIHWIENEFKKAGLKPASDESYLQRVPLVEYRPDPEYDSLTVRRGNQSTTYKAPDATSSSRASKVEGPVVFAGYGITATELRYDDYAGLNATGKIVLVFDHEPQEYDPQSRFNGKGSTRYAGSFIKALNAQRHGAAALVIVAEPNRQHLSNAERLAKIRGPEHRARIAIQALEDSQVKIPILTISDKAAEDLLGGRGKELQSAIDASLKPQSRDLGARAEINVQNEGLRQGVSYNVAGIVEGSDPKLRNETVVFSAHYDHDGPALNGAFYPGAGDDGSGTVGVIELARAFAKNEIKPRAPSFSSCSRRRSEACSALTTTLRTPFDRLKRRAQWSIST